MAKKNMFQATRELSGEVDSLLGKVERTKERAEEALTDLQRISGNLQADLAQRQKEAQVQKEQAQRERESVDAAEALRAAQALAESEAKARLQATARKAELDKAVEEPSAKITEPQSGVQEAPAEVMQQPKGSTPVEGSENKRSPRDERDKTEVAAEEPRKSEASPAPAAPAARAPETAETPNEAPKEVSKEAPAETPKEVSKEPHKDAPKAASAPAAPRAPGQGQPRPAAGAPAQQRPAQSPRPMQPRPQGAPAQGAAAPRPAQSPGLKPDGTPRAPLGGGPFIPKPVQPGQQRPAPQGRPGAPLGGGPFVPKPLPPGQQRPAPSGGTGAPGRPMGPRPAAQAGGAPRPGGFGGGPRPAGGGAGGGRPMGGGGGGGGRFAKKGPELTPTVEKERVSNYDPNKSAYERVHDPEKKVRSRKTSDRPPSISSDDEFVRGRRPKSKKLTKAQEMSRIEKAVMTAETITVKDLTERIGRPAGEIIKKLLLLGVIATINQELDYDTAQLVAQEFGVELTLKLEKTAEETMQDESSEDDPSLLISRPPVVTIMGHVDHGKTSLLDHIRATRVTAGEAGGITQHIGAYQIDVRDRRITFLDTPGHEAFTAMRMRGAQVTDIAVLVVAADDGIMPQTVEAINHAKVAGVPIIVAVNKIDRPAANVERIKQELTEHNLVAEEWGGDTIVAPVSALTGEGVENLLDMILLTADVADLKANPNRLAKGAIVEAKLDKGRGPVATVLVQNGTLHVGDTIVAGTAYGRVRAMVDDKGKQVTEAPPSAPVEVIGFSEVPEAGDVLNAVEQDKLNRLVAEERRDKAKEAQLKAMAKVSLEDLFTQIEQGQIKDLNVIIKADVQGSVEAIRSSLEKLSNEEVRVRCVHGAVGAITQADVMLASASNAIIIGFNVRPDLSGRAAAERESIDIRMYRVIYQAIEDIQSAMKGMLKPIFKENLLGRAQVRQVFKVTGAGTIAGSYVLDGKIQRNAQVRLLRDNIVIHEGKLSSLKRFKDDAREVATGYECGIGLESYNDIKENDVIECFIMEEIKR